MASARVNFSSGSSPLTRGKLATLGYSTAWRGLIPAHAGKTRRFPTPSPWLWAHPRSRGENSDDTAARQPNEGSSPLTRGKLLARRVARRHGGLIPTHAGKTDALRRYPTQAQAHPHSRGENHMPSDNGMSYSGSSPLTRGKHVECEQIPRLQGPIPAHAGKTCRSRQVQPGVSAHPHSCGENSPASGVRTRFQGSSPLTRGTLSQVSCGEAVVRLIPAHEGKTRRATKRAARLRAHPRSCGENVRCGVCQVPSTGSSPLTRGKRRPHR